MNLKATIPKAARLLGTIAISLLMIASAGVLILNLCPKPLLGLPESTWQLRKSDAIIVLGTPTKKDGKATPSLRERVRTGVDLYKRGMATKLIVTGAAAHNKFVEADVMAADAELMGVPADKIIREREAKNTYQNAFDSYLIMKAEGMKSAIVVSSPAHLLRANLIFSRYPIEYCVFGCDYPAEQNAWDRLIFDQREKYFVLADLILNKGILLGLKPEQAQQMPQIAKEAELMHSQSK